MDVTKLTPSCAPGHTLLPATNGSSRKSCPFKSTSSSRNLPSRNSEGFFHTAGSRATAHLIPWVTRPELSHTNVFCGHPTRGAQWKWCKRWPNMDVTKLTPSCAPGHTLLPATNGSSRKSCPFKSTSSSRNLPSRNSEGFFHTARSRATAHLIPWKEELELQTRTSLCSALGPESLPRLHRVVAKRNADLPRRHLAVVVTQTLLYEIRETRSRNRNPLLRYTFEPPIRRHFFFFTLFELVLMDCRLLSFNQISGLACNFRAIAVQKSNPYRLSSFTRPGN
ncbi:unnamed protein product [Fraxinus pennsylvanica]|uniref:Uncharacterized protein n=1 Tax=Fraxinus pennsylvanica TaxID=56036 RepID=A0AAD1Z8R6_9LAMI|nr:unnamed protein product [Fraxinus pennsylvanica]